MLRREAQYLGWPLTILFAPVFIYQHIRGVGPVPNYYGAKAEAIEQEETMADCRYCGMWRIHYKVVWLDPYCETLECSACSTIVEI